MMANAEEFHYQEVCSLVALISMVKIKFMDSPEIYRTLLAFLCDYDPSQPGTKERTVKYIRLLITDEALANCIVMSLPEVSRQCVKCSDSIPKSLGNRAECVNRQRIRMSPSQLDIAPGVKSICHLPPATTARQTGVCEEKKAEPLAVVVSEPAPCSTVTQCQDKVTIQSSTSLPTAHSPAIITCNRGPSVSQIKPFKSAPSQAKQHCSLADGSQKTPASSAPNSPLFGAPWSQGQPPKVQGQIPTTRLSQAFTPPVGMMLPFPYGDYRLPIQCSQFTGMQPVIGTGTMLPWQYANMAAWRGQTISSESSIDLSVQNQPVDLTGHGKKGKSAAKSHTTGQNKLKRSVSSTVTSAADRNGSTRPKLQKMNSDSELNRPAGISKESNNGGLEKTSACQANYTPLGSLYDLVSAIEVREDMKSTDTSNVGKTVESEATGDARVADNSVIKKSMSAPVTEQASHFRYPPQISSPQDINVASTAYFSTSNTASMLGNAIQVGSYNAAQINNSMTGKENSYANAQFESRMATQLYGNTSLLVNKQETVCSVSDSASRAFPYSQQIYLPNGNFSVVNLQRETLAMPNQSPQSSSPNDYQSHQQITWNKGKRGPISITRRSCSLSDILHLAQSESAKTLNSPVTPSEQSSDGVARLKSVVTETTKSGNSTTLKIKLSNSEKLLEQILRMQQTKVSGYTPCSSAQQSHNAHEARRSSAAFHTSSKKTSPNVIDQNTDQTPVTRNEKFISSTSQGRAGVRELYSNSGQNVGIITLSGNNQLISTSSPSLVKAEQFGIKTEVQTVATTSQPVMNASPALQVFSTPTMGQAFAIQPKPDFAANTISITDKAFLQTIKQRLQTQTKQQRALSDSALLNLYSKHSVELQRASEQAANLGSDATTSSQIAQNSGLIAKTPQNTQNSDFIGETQQKAGLLTKTSTQLGDRSAYGVTTTISRQSLPPNTQAVRKIEDCESEEEEDEVFTEARITDAVMECPFRD